MAIKSKINYNNSNVLGTSIFSKEEISAPIDNIPVQSVISYLETTNITPRDYYKGTSFRYSGGWLTGTHYLNDQYFVDFVVINNVLLRCKKSHLSSLESKPVRFIYDDKGNIVGIDSEYWDFVLSGFNVGEGSNFQRYYEGNTSEVANPGEGDVCTVPGSNTSYIYYKGVWRPWLYISSSDIINWNNKTDKVSGATSGNVPSLDSNGNLVDSGMAVTDFVTRSVNDLINYYTKSEVYNKTEITNLLGNIHQFTYQTANALPQVSEETMYIIYLIPSEDPQAQNIKDEYITVRSGEEGHYTYSWEQIGSTAIDLSDYITTSALTTALANYVTSSTFQQTIASLLDIEDLDGVFPILVNPDNYYTKFETDSLLSDKYTKPVNGIPVEDLVEDAQPVVIRGTGERSALIKNVRFPNTASGSDSFAGGHGSTASGDYSSFAYGYNTTASGYASFAEGRDTIASGAPSHAEGEGCVASGRASHAECGYSTAIGSYTHSEGRNTIAKGISAHAEGYFTRAFGDGTHSEAGYDFLTVYPIGDANATVYTFSKSENSWLIKYITDAELIFLLTNNRIGIDATVSGEKILSATVEHSNNNVIVTIITEKTLSETALTGNQSYRISISGGYGVYSHSEGGAAFGKSSHVEGLTISLNQYEHTSGYNNLPRRASSTLGDSGNTAYTLGIGYNNVDKNAVEYRQNGDMYLIGVGEFDGIDTNGTASTVQDVINSKYVKPVSGIPSTDFTADVQASLSKADTAIQSFTETDPTVPSWAKASSKPSYDYSEIGNTPTIPDAVEANPTVPSGTTSTSLTGLKIGSSYYDVATGGGTVTDVTVGGTSVVSNGVAAVPAIPDVTGKADKVSNATNGNFAALDSNGNLIDSGHKHSDYLTSHQDISGKADKVSNATNGHLAALDGNGNLTDSGKSASDLQPTIDASHKLAASLVSGLATVATSGSFNDLSNKPDEVEANPTVPSGTTPTALSGLKVGTDYYDIEAGGGTIDAEDYTGTAPLLVNPSNYYTKSETEALVETPVASAQPSGGFLPNVIYDLGEITGSMTFALATPTDNTIANTYVWTFETGSTAPTIVWPANLTWLGGDAPTINTSKHYEITVRKGYANCLEF